VEFRAYCRADESLVLVPSLFETPLAAERSGVLTLVGAVTIDLGRPAHRFLNPLVGLMAAVLGTSMVAFVLVGGLASMLMTIAAVSGLYGFLKRFVAPPVVTVGQDGLRLRRFLRTVHVTKEDIRRVWIPEEEGDLLVARRSGKSEHVSSFLLDYARMRAIVELVDERLTPQRPPERAAAFERGGRDVATWRTEMRAALAPGYRASRVTVEEAAEVLESPHSTVDQRLGAAIALRMAAEPPERIRVAADGLVDQKVRVALDAIAEDEDDERIEKTLKRLSR